ADPALRHADADLVGRQRRVPVQAAPHRRGDVGVGTGVALRLSDLDVVGDGPHPADPLGGGLGGRSLVGAGDHAGQRDHACLDRDPDLGGFHAPLPLQLALDVVLDLLVARGVSHHGMNSSGGGRTASALTYRYGCTGTPAAV